MSHNTFPSRPRQSRTLAISAALASLLGMGFVPTMRSRATERAMMQPKKRTTAHGACNPAPDAARRLGVFVQPVGRRAKRRHRHCV